MQEPEEVGLRVEEFLEDGLIEEVVDAARSGKPCYLPGANRQFKDIFGIDAFWKCIPTTAPRAAFPRAYRGIEQIPIQFEVSAIREALSAGDSVQVARIDRVCGTLDSLRRAIQAKAGLPGSASCHAYVSPPGTGYSFLHVDAGLAVTLQFEGSKTWRFSRAPAIEWPLGSGGYRAQQFEWFGNPLWRPPETNFSPPKESELISQTIYPGDVLIVPSGVWHCAQSLDSPSLSVNLRLNPAPSLECLLQVLTEHLIEDVRFRAPIPFHARSDPRWSSAREESIAHLRSLISRMRELLAEIESDDSHMAGLWARNFPDASAPSSNYPAAQPQPSDPQ